MAGAIAFKLKQGCLCSFNGLLLFKNTQEKIHTKGKQMIFTQFTNHPNEDIHTILVYRFQSCV